MGRTVGATMVVMCACYLTKMCAGTICFLFTKHKMIIFQCAHEMLVARGHCDTQVCMQGWLSYTNFVVPKKCTIWWLNLRCYIFTITSYYRKGGPLIYNFTWQLLKSTCVGVIFHEKHHPCLTEQYTRRRHLKLDRNLHLKMDESCMHLAVIFGNCCIVIVYTQETFPCVIGHIVHIVMRVYSCGLMVMHLLFLHSQTHTTP